MASKIVRSLVRWTANMVGLVVVAALYNPQWDLRRVWAVLFIGLWFTSVEMAVFMAGTARPRKTGVSRPIAVCLVVAGIAALALTARGIARDLRPEPTIIWHDGQTQYEIRQRFLEQPGDHVRRAQADFTNAFAKD